MWFCRVPVWISMNLLHISKPTLVTVSCFLIHSTDTCTVQAVAKLHSAIKHDDMGFKEVERKFLWSPQQFRSMKQEWHSNPVLVNCSVYLLRLCLLYALRIQRINCFRNGEAIFIGPQRSCWEPLNSTRLSASGRSLLFHFIIGFISCYPFFSTSFSIFPFFSSFLLTPILLHSFHTLRFLLHITFFLHIVTCFLGNVTSNSWNACLTLGSIWPFLGRATTIHFTNLLHTNKSLVWNSRCNFWTILSAGLSLLLDWTEVFWTLVNWTEPNWSWL
jgi:hypothetical protein